MARIHIRNTQENALKFLQIHYQKKFEASPVFAQKNISTKNGHKLDGLIACRKPTRGTFTSAIEVRSLASIHNVLPLIGEVRWIWRLLLAGLLLAGFTAAVGFFLPKNVMHVLIPAAVAMAGYLVYGFVSGEHKKFSASRLVNTLNRMPANEKWLVLTIDSDVMALHAKIDLLRYQCERKGIGILSVSNGRKVSIVQLPKEQLTMHSDYLSHFGQQQEILQFLTTRPAYTPVPAPAAASVGLTPIPALVKAS